MAIYTIKDETLTAIADAIREKKNEIKPVQYTGTITANIVEGEEMIFVKDVQYKLIFTPTTQTVYGDSGISLIIEDKATLTTYRIKEYEIYEPEKTVEIIFSVPFNGVGRLGIGTASYQTKLYADYVISGGNIYKPVEMANAIGNLNLIPDVRLALTNDIGYIDYYGKWDWFFTAYRDKITFNDVSNLSYIFYQSKLTDIPWEINVKSPTSGSQAVRAFSYSSITNIPIINNGVFSSLEAVFSNCSSLTNIPDDFWPDCKLANTTASMNGMFQYCYKLRKLPIGFINRLVAKQTGYSSPMYYLAYTCYSLDNVLGVLPPDSTLTSNMFYYTVDNTQHLKDFTFVVNEDGSVLQRNWKAQAIDFSKYVGYGNNLTKYFSTTTQIKDDESYELLKDHPDAWTSNIAYSRYNHDSAVRTINSLPDTSTYLATAGGTNTIKFKGASGSATDGGAINTLTEEEIAVATAKGWTVSLV